MNHIFRVIWNQVTEAWQAVTEVARGHSKSNKTAKTVLMAGLGCVLGLAGAAHAELPTGGNIVAGSGSISSTGNTMTVVQTTDRMAANWQSFSIGQGKTVNFVQPSSSAVALNRVLGSDVSVIQGSINANGKIFLLNPNGVLFTPTAQVNVGSIVASTLSMSTADFMAGNYKFEGNSSNAIVNQGNITAAEGGTIALVAAKIINDGTLTANAGNVLLGAGSKVTLDLGGPVKLQVENDTLETLIANGGAIKANGGTVLLTSQAAANLASSVINNTGVIEANSLNTGEKGNVVLFAHGGAMNLGGSIQAEGGFVETSGKIFTVQPGATVKAAQWLIDPVNVTINNTLAGTIESALGNGDVTITTDGGNTPDTSSGESGTVGDITVSAPMTWSANKLTLNAYRNININATLDASGGGSLALQYGQGSADGAGGTYTVGADAKIYIPDADAFTWRKGSSGVVNNLIFDNGNLRFGNGTEAALTTDGQLKQPFYKNKSSDDPSGSCNLNDWCQLTFSSYPLDIAVGAGGDGTGSSTWNYNGEVLKTDRRSNYFPAQKKLEISGYKEGVGTVISTGTLTFSSGDQIKVDNAYTLDAGVSFVKTVTTLTNVNSGSVAIENIRLWVGTRDDYVAGNDDNYKLKGNLTSSGFEAITAQDQQAKALQVKNSDGNDGTAILFYSTSNGADTVSDQCCSFSNVTSKNPRTSEILTAQEDGSYGLFIRLNNLAASASDGMTWYYAAAPVSQINAVVNTVAQSAGVAPSTPSTPSTPTVAAPSLPLEQAIQRAAQQPNDLDPRGLVNGRAQTDLAPTGRPPAQVTLPQQAALPVVDLSGGLAFVELAGTPATSGAGQAVASSADLVPPAGITGMDPLGFMRVFVTQGGINMPSNARTDAAAENARRKDELSR